MCYHVLDRNSRVTKCYKINKQGNSNACCWALDGNSGCYQVVETQCVNWVLGRDSGVTKWYKLRLLGSIIACSHVHGENEYDGVFGSHNVVC